MDTRSTLKDKLNAMKETLPPLILEDHFVLRPDMAEQYNAHQKLNFQKDVAWILSFLAESVWAGQPVLFEEFIAWLRTFLGSVNVPMKDVRESLELIHKRIADACSDEECRIMEAYFLPVIAQFDQKSSPLSIPAMEHEMDPAAGQYLEFLLKGNRNGAMQLVLDMVKTGTSIRHIYTEIFQPVQYEIGRLWQTNQISVAQEHYSTGATQLVMSQLYPYLFTGRRKERKMVTTCVPGELHELGARMVTDFFEMEGWDTFYLGANMPVDGLIRYIREVRPQLLAISATMTYHVSQVEEMIRKVRSVPEVPPQMKILVGGYPFRISDNLWQTVGANACAGSAQEAVQIAEKILAA